MKQNIENASEQQEFEIFFRGLCEAIRRIRMDYFLARSVGGWEDYRERVYCYELYHQLRIVLGDASKYRLYGEMDKRGTLVEEKMESGSMPDFIYHIPGKNRNLVVMEVKAADRNINKIKEDIGKIINFLERLSYYRGILLLVGNVSSREKIRRIVRTVKEELESHKDLFSRFIVLWHNAVGRNPETLLGEEKCDAKCYD